MKALWSRLSFSSAFVGRISACPSVGISMWDTCPGNKVIGEHTKLAKVYFQEYTL